MNKFFLATAFVMALTGSALAHKKTVVTDVPLVPGAVVTPQGVKVQAPPGSDVQVDVDGKDVDITITGPGPKTGFSSVLPWNWSVWR